MLTLAARAHRIFGLLGLEVRSSHVLTLAARARRIFGLLVALCPI